MNRIESTYSHGNTQERARQAMVRQILARIEEGNIALHEDPELLRLISRLQLLGEIPEQLTGAAHEILSFIFQVEKDLTTAKDSHHG